MRAPAMLLLSTIALCPSLARATQVGWSGAVRLGVGGALTGPRAGAGGVDLAFRFDVIIRRGDVEEFWGTGPYIDARTLAFVRHDVLGGVAVATPTWWRLFGATARAGVGYRWASDGDLGAVLATTIAVGVRLPIKAHEDVVLGIYADGRVLLERNGAAELTTGIEVDPVGLVAALFEKTHWEPPSH
jgi:hypothetical protein